MAVTATDRTLTLSRNTNQALGIGKFACDFMSGDIGNPDISVRESHRSVFC